MHRFTSSSPSGRVLSALSLGGLALALSACQDARSIPIASQCDGEVTVVIHDNVYGGEAMQIPPEGTTVDIPTDPNRVWFESADGEVLGEVTLTADQLADTDANFDELVIEKQSCTILEPAPEEAGE